MKPVAMPMSGDTSESKPLENVEMGPGGADEGKFSNMLKTWLDGYDDLMSSDLESMPKDQLISSLRNSIEMIQEVLKSNISLWDEAMKAEDKIEYLYE